MYNLFTPPIFNILPIECEPPVLFKTEFPETPERDPVS